MNIDNITFRKVAAMGLLRGKQIKKKRRKELTPKDAAILAYLEVVSRQALQKDFPILYEQLSCDAAKKAASNLVTRRLN